MKSHSLILLAATAVLTLCPALSRSQDLLRADVLDSFRPVEHWRGVKDVAAVPDKTEFQISGEGAILVNGDSKDKQIPYLITKDDYGDVRIELEFMVPKNSNAGVYVMGRYEVQILDSFGRPRVGSGDLGGIYERYDPARPKGQQGFEGTAPKTNAAKAPGEWQTLDIHFRAPRFNEAGVKLSDATFEKVFVNGILVQENATTTGPTRSSPLEGETNEGPIAIQGDHGPIAIRAFRVTPLADPEQVRLSELDAYWAEVSRAVREGDFEAYKATCHPEGVLISGRRKYSQPLATALARWQKDFADTREGRVKATADFRFSKRLGDATTAHETGILRFISQAAGEAPKVEYIDLEALLVRKPDGWKILMEYQIGETTEAAWEAVHSHQKEGQRVHGGADASNVQKALEKPAKKLPLPGETFTVEGRPAFLILPQHGNAAKPTPWVWYAPTLPKLPGNEEKWMFEKFLAAGIAIAGIDVGESMGNPEGRALFTAFHKELVSNRGMSAKPCLLARSRGGLMLYNWAAENPQSVAAIAGIYPVGNLASWPGLAKSALAYGLAEKELADQLANHNPIDRLAPLAKAGIPIMHIHGDNDSVVPLEQNSGMIKQRYDQLGGTMILEVIKGGGHDMKGHWFKSQTLVDFVIGRIGGS